MKDQMQQNQKSGKQSKTLLIILIGLLVVVVAVGAGFFVNGKMKEKGYSEAIASAEKYLAQNNYEDAIVEYKKAIKLNPEDPDAYIDLADVYVEQEDESKAKSILKRGYTKTKSPKIRLMLNRLESAGILTEDLVQKEETQALDLATASQDIGWNTSFLQKLESFDFDDYRDEYGSVQEAKSGDGGFIEIVHSGLDGICYYRNTTENKEIVDTSRKTPEADGMPEKISLNSLDLLFRNFEGGVSLQRLQMLIGERVEPKRLGDRTVLEIKTESIVMYIESDVEGNVVSPNAWNEIVLLNANQKDDEEGHLSGVVIDAVTGDGVNGAELSFILEDKSSPEKQVKTNASGAFSVDLEPGLYTILIEAKDYVEEEFVFEIEKGKSYSGEEFVISPELAKGTARIVLEWGSEPQDLDSYLRGETDGGDDVDVNFRNRQSKAGGNTIAELDLDDTNGNGPETTTIYNLNGVYTFQVADFRRTGTMKQFGATVKVYLPGKQPETITIAPGADVKDIWIVCEIDHGELNIINEAPDSDNFTTSNK